MISLHKFLNKNIIKSCKVTCSRRWFHGEQLKNRSLVRVSGHESKDFLQGLITNDMEHLTDHASSMFTMFLNVQGRVLFDSIIFKTDDKESFIIDCDSEVMQPLINHMKLYKVRRKINFEQLKCYSLWVVFDKDIDVKKLESTNIDALYLNPQSKFQSSYKEKLNLPNGTIVATDPRLQYLGDRIILPSESTLETNPSLTLVSGSFDKLRLKLGVGEGIHEIIRGKSLPLEINCDYLHGVSFQKGCYIGQELTARTYHTGVIRKRIMPLTFDSDVSNQQNSSITNEKGKNVGKVIRTFGEFGIGLLRINEVLKAKNLNTGKINVKTFRPGWWPIEASKDRQSLTSND